ncbi:putative zinc-binding oxidoreductase [Cadophora sp. MPI-SDFR-AT-0126]|nr:putative zinc-binding oxidoreductase [Leotiomycetes sp. MPI-SDFR-AT-0126]
MSQTMKAIVITAPGGPEVLETIDLPKPVPKPGQVLIRVKAFGVNRSEMFTRQGISADVKFPRVPGIEAVGLVDDAPGGEFREGDVVATCMGGMGRAFDGGYAEYTCVPASFVLVIKTKISWEQLGALPEMISTVWHSLFLSLQLKKEDYLLIRGGTSSIGLAAAAIAKGFGCASVAATTRNRDRVAMLTSNGADDVFLDNGSIVKEVRLRRPKGYSKVLELVGPAVLEDSLKCVEEQGIVCVTGVAGGKWTIDSFHPFMIPTSVCLTSYTGQIGLAGVPLDEIAQQLVDGALRIPIKTFHMSEIVEVHRMLEESSAAAKIVVLV